MSEKLRDKVCLVTGAASGIGRATALALRERGAKLMIVDIDEAGLAALRATLGDACLLHARVDVSDAAAVARLAEQVHVQVPALDVLVNNAGVALGGGVETTLDDWRWLMGVNLWGVVHGCHAFVPAMQRRRGGVVVNIASVLGLVASPHTLAYSASKFAVVGLSESLRAEVAPDGVHVATICPGLIATNIIDNGRFSAKASDKEKTMARDFFRKRGASPDRVAAAIVDAIERRRALVPVAPEAWALYYLKRVSPHATAFINRLANRLRPH